MKETQELALSFFPLQESNFDFEVYRKEIDEFKKIEEEGVFQFRLPNSHLDSENPDYRIYQISFNSKSAYDKFTCKSEDNILLTNRYLYNLLKLKTKNAFEQNNFWIDKGYYNRVYFNINEHQEGWETVWLEPYYLKENNEFGFLTDFHFRKKDSQEFNREVQKHSLSLDKNYQENKNFYVSKSEKIQKFLSGPFKKINTLGKGGHKIKPKFSRLQCSQLDTKKYLFKGNKSEKSQFKGVTKYGPINSVNKDSILCFIYRAQDKSYSYDLYKALRGDSFATFRGMQEVFNFNFHQENIEGQEIKEFDKEEIDKTLSSLFERFKDKPFVPIIIFPWDKNEATEKEAAIYNYIKYQLLDNRITSQFVSLNILKDQNKLKWAIANIALQLYSKMGGIPWKVSPKTKNCLIIGLGQAHKYSEDGNIEKFFAYSVMTDSSGIYQDIKVLGHSNNKSKYLQELSTSIKKIIHDYKSEFENIAIHTPYNIKFDEIECIKESLPTDLEELDKIGIKKIVVLKFNDYNKFFCYVPNHNSLTPYESTYTSLAYDEFLVWFEGLQYHTSNIRKRIGGPVHIEFLYPKKQLSLEEKIYYLQDAINLSGANWRGFNAKSLPVSIYYAQLIAQYFREFNKQGLNNLDIENLNPWFL